VADAVGRDLDVDAAVEGPRVETEMDLASFLVMLQQARTVIDLPTYRRRRQATVSKDEIVVSSEHRHGPVLSLTSNQAVWSFGVVVDDANVMTVDGVGRPRTFMIQDLDGTFYDGWSTIQFQAARLPEQIRTALAGVQTVMFNKFVSESRWGGFYSRRHLLAKAAEARIADEQRFLKAERKRLYSDRGDEAPGYTPTTKVGAAVKQDFWAFESKMDLPDFSGEYTGYPNSADSLQKLGDRLHRLDQLQKIIRFCYRATEFAFWRDVVTKQLGQEPGHLLGWLAGGDGSLLKVPSWSAGEWVTGAKESAKARTHYAQIEREGHPTLRWRCWQKSENVAADIDE
jgi:hypothetical protein